MENYTSWLKNCIEGIKNVDLGNMSGYGQALYWQFMFLGTIILTLIVVAAVFCILYFGCRPVFIHKEAKTTLHR